MLTLAQIFQRYGPLYRDLYGDRMLKSHLRAMRDIEQCRTEAMGGHVLVCPACEHHRYHYHSCKNRHCPACQNDAAEKWLEQQRNLLLPITYFLATFTLPEQLRELARSNQKTIYTILFTAAAEALQVLAADPHFVGGMIGTIAVLHTWARDMAYHPHIHFLVPAGAISPDESAWIPARYHDYLVPVKALSIIFRAKFRDALAKTDLHRLVDQNVWSVDWVVHCQPAGKGEHALKYLAPYVYRVALTNNRLVALENDQVTFRFRKSGKKAWSTMTLPVLTFIHRFLQHVLPPGFVKVRYYGFLSFTKRALLRAVRYVLALRHRPKKKKARPPILDKPPQPPRSKLFICPRCGETLIIKLLLPPTRKRAPPP
jgi:hypothetical protein